jgi:HemY protein
MADHADTRLLGLHGLFVEAQRRGDMAAAHAFAEEAVRANPAVGWAAQAVLDFRCRQGDWSGALAALDSNMKSGQTDKPSFRRSRAVLLTARALTSQEREAVRADVTEAVHLAPGLVPAAALAGRLLAESGEMRKASRILEAAWRANPHPDLAETYAHVRPGDAARDRLARMQTLAKLKPDHPEGALAVARAAIDAREFAVARAALAPLALAPTRRVALLMAELEQQDTGDVGRARQWMARAVHAGSDPAWTADGLVSDKWLPVSPATGRLDAFEWRVPLADLSPPGHVIEQAEEAPVPVSYPMRDDEAPEMDGAPSHPTPRPEAPLPVVPAAPARAVVPPPRVAGVIPLVHSPDDPGPDAELVAEPAPEPPTTPDGWSRLRGLFR